MGWLATTCWGATTHGKDREKWEEQINQSRAQPRRAHSSQTGTLQRRSRGEASSNDHNSSPPTSSSKSESTTRSRNVRDQDHEKSSPRRKRSQSALVSAAAALLSTISKGAQNTTAPDNVLPSIKLNDHVTKSKSSGSDSNKHKETAAVSFASPPAVGVRKRKGDATPPIPPLRDSPSPTPLAAKPSTKDDDGVILRTPQRMGASPTPSAPSSSNNTTTPLTTKRSDHRSRSPPMGDPDKVLPPPSMIVWANQRNYSACLRPSDEQPKFFQADLGAFAQSDTRGEMQRVQCQELCAEKRLVDFKLEEAVREAKAQRQRDIRLDTIQKLADEHSTLMSLNIKRHDEAQAEKRAALEKVIWRKNRRNLPAIDRCDGEKEENALRAASFLTIIHVAQRFSQFFLRAQQFRMMGVLRKLLGPVIRLRIARRKRLAKSYVSAFVKLQRNPRPTPLDLMRCIADLQTWPASQEQLFHARIRPLYVPKGVALCYEGEPVSFVFILMQGKLTATQSLSRFKASVGGGAGGGGLDDGFGGGGGLANKRLMLTASAGARRARAGLGSAGISRSAGRGAIGNGSTGANNNVIHLGEKTAPFVLGEELTSIKDEQNVKSFAIEDAAILNIDLEEENCDAEESEAQHKADHAPTTTGRPKSSSVSKAGKRAKRGGSAAPKTLSLKRQESSSKFSHPEGAEGDEGGEESGFFLPPNRATHRKRQKKRDVEIQKAEDERIAHLQQSVYHSAIPVVIPPPSFLTEAAGGTITGNNENNNAHTCSTPSGRHGTYHRVVNGVVDALPFPLVLRDFKGGPPRKLKAQIPKRSVAVPCFHGRHTTTLRGSHATNGCYGWLISADQLSELVRDSAELTAAGLGEATGEVAESGLKRRKSRANFGESGIGASAFGLSVRKDSENGSTERERRGSASSGGTPPVSSAAVSPSPAPSAPPAAPVRKKGVARGLAGLLGATRAVATRGTAMDRVTHHQLRENRIFELFEPNEAQALIPRSTVCSFMRGQCIYKYNDPENDVYVVAKGVVEVKGRVANPYHPNHAQWLAHQGLAPNGQPLYSISHTSAAFSPSASVYFAGSPSALGAASRSIRGGPSTSSSPYRPANTASVHAAGSGNMAGSPSRALLNNNNSNNIVGAFSANGGGWVESNERARPETRFINVGYCLGDEDAIFSQWRSETAVAATDCVLLKFKAYDLISALTAKTVRYQQLKELYNEEAVLKFVIPPTPQVINALLVKGDGFPTLIETAMGAHGKRKAAANVTDSSSLASQQSQQAKKGGGVQSPLQGSSSISGSHEQSLSGPSSPSSARDEPLPLPNASANVSSTNPNLLPANSIVNTNLNTNFVWPFTFLVGGGKRIDEPTSAELLAELLAGKGSHSEKQSSSSPVTRNSTNNSGGGAGDGSSGAGGGSAFNLGGMDLRRTNILMQYVVSVTLARASLANLTTVIGPESLKTIITRYSSVGLESLGVVGIMDTPAAANASSSAANVVTKRDKERSGDDGTPKPANSPAKTKLAGVKGGIAASMALFGAGGATTEKKPKANNKTTGGVGGSSSSLSGSIIVQSRPSLFSSFFHSVMRGYVRSPGALLPSHTGIIFLQKGVVELFAEAGSDSRTLGGAAGPRFGSECVTVAAPAIIISSTAFKHVKEQFIRCLVNGAIDFVNEPTRRGAGMANVEGSSTADSSSRGGGVGPPPEIIVTKQLLVEEAIKSGLLQDPDGSVAASVGVGTDGNSHGGLGKGGALAGNKSTQQSFHQKKGGIVDSSRARNGGSTAGSVSNVPMSALPAPTVTGSSSATSFLTSPSSPLTSTSSPRAPSLTSAKGGANTAVTAGKPISSLSGTRAQSPDTQPNPPSNPHVSASTAIGSTTTRVTNGLSATAKESSIPASMITITPPMDTIQQQQQQQNHVTAKLSHAPTIVFKYAVSHAAALDTDTIRLELSGGSKHGGGDSAVHFSSSSGAFPSAAVTTRQIEQYRQFELTNEGNTELSMLSEELAKLSGAQKVTAKSRVTFWHVQFVDVIRRFYKFTPSDLVRATSAANGNAAAAHAAISNPTITSYNHLPQEVLDFFPEKSLGAESELQSLVDGGGIFILK